MAAVPHDLAALLPNPMLDPLVREYERLSRFEQRILTRKFSKQKKVGRFLYKYRSVDGAYADQTLEDIIVHSVLRMGSAAEFNDPFDMAAYIYAEGTEEQRRVKMSQLIRQNGADVDGFDETLRRFMAIPLSDFVPTLKNSQQVHRQSIGVTCFATNVRNLLMWSHYAGQHRGICLVFDTSLDFHTLAHAVRVDYLVDYPLINWIDGFEEQIMPMLLRKHPCWSYEGERRIILPEQAGKYLPFRPQALSSVILGACATDRTAGLIGELLRKRADAGMPAVATYRAALHARQYRLVFRQNK
jgi:hypothetical protein